MFFKIGLQTYKICFPVFLWILQNFQEKLLSQNTSGDCSIHLKPYNYVTNPWFHFPFLVLIVQLLDHNSNTHKSLVPWAGDEVDIKILEEKLNFAEQIFTMEPISIIFAEFNFAIWGQKRKNRFHKNLLLEN